MAILPAESSGMWELPHSLQLGPRQATHRNNESKRFHDARNNEADATM
jgi:hypothetical protein